MRILFFHPLLGHLWRGIERNVVVLSSGMAQHGHTVSVLTVNHPEQALLADLNPHVRVHRAPYSRYYTYQLAVPYFISHLVRHEYDAIIVFFGGFGVGPSLAAIRRLKASRTFIFLGYPVDVAPHRYNELERWSLPRHAAEIWAHGDHVAAGAEMRFQRPVVPLPTGVDTNRFTADPEARARMRVSLGIGETDPVILTVSALDERKGIQHVLDALPRVLQRLPDLKYVIVGDGDFRDALRLRIDGLGLSRSVIMTGAYADVEQLYPMADVFCLLARGEAGPIVLYEALAAGLPVVTLSAPHLTQHLSADQVEFLDAVSPDAIADSLVRLLSDAPRRERMGRSGRSIVEAEYGVERLCRTVEDLIERPSAAREADPTVPLSSR